LKLRWPFREAPRAADAAYAQPAPIARRPSDGVISARRKILVLGNCQARPLSACLGVLAEDVAATGVETPTTSFEDKISARDSEVLGTLQAQEYILLQPYLLPLFQQNLPDLLPRIRLFPVLAFAAFHPDLVYVQIKSLQQHLVGPLNHYHSAIALWGFRQGLSVPQTVKLFNEHSYRTLGYFDYWEASHQAMINEGLMANMPLDDHLARWQRSGCFMHSVNHPQLSVTADVAVTLLSNLGIPVITGAARYLQDELSAGPVWPVYPEIAQQLGIGGGSYWFKVERGRSPPDRPVLMLDLAQFVEASFTAFSAYEPGDLHCDRLDTAAFRGFGRAVAPMPKSAPLAVAQNIGGASGRQSSPYRDLPGHQFWRKAISELPASQIDPVVGVRFQIQRSDKVATAGSCFAQHISRTLQKSGFNYFNVETSGELTVEEAHRRNFGVFSARFGNIYTARQLLQLTQSALGRFTPADSVWVRDDGRFVDPFRPQVEPDGFADAESVMTARRLHLHSVREMLERLDVLVFTLGLTEAWRSKIDGAVFPLAPGVAGGSMDPERHEYVNFGTAEVVADLKAFIELLSLVNPRARIVLTVSPVPLIATYEKQHVLVSTTLSKAVLRSAAAEVCNFALNCEYFPSYEIITGNFSRGSYFESDLRTVAQDGIEHVMRIFLKHYAGTIGVPPVDPAQVNELQKVAAIVCDEDAIGRI